MKPIAERPGKRHEKFAVKSVQISYDEAINKITGHGGLTSQVETLKTLGAKTSKKIDPKFLPNPEDS